MKEVYTMRTSFVPSRRAVIVGLAACAAAPLRAAEPLPKLTVTKDPSCGCCGAWVEHIKAAGFPVEVIESGEVNRLKAKLGVPRTLASCHTAEVAGYVVEGHVRAGSIKRLIAEKPQAKGLAVPGMPVGSPGMEVEGTKPEVYDVILFGPAGQRTFERYQGAHTV